MSVIVVLGIVMLSLMSLFTSTFLNKINVITNERSIILLGIVQFWVVMLTTYKLFRRHFRNIDPLMYVFSLLCTDASYSLYSILEMDNIVLKSKWVKIATYKPYMKTAHGVLQCYWNGIVHYILCIAAIALYTHRDSHREVVLYWAGSLLNSMLVLVPSCFLDDEAGSVSTLFNVFYAFLAVTTIVYCIDRRPCQKVGKNKIYKSFWRRKIDLIFLVYFFIATVVAISRGLAVIGGESSFLKNYIEVYEPYLEDPSNFPKFQALTYEYLFVVYYVAAIYGLASPGQYWMADWALIHAGAAAQAQVIYICGSVHYMTLRENHPPRSGFPAVVFWAVNMPLFIVPQLFAWWCQKHPDYFGPTYTVDIATPIQPHLTGTPKKFE